MPTHLTAAHPPKRGRGRPKGSKNKPKEPLASGSNAVGDSKEPGATVSRPPGRPKKNPLLGRVRVIEVSVSLSASDYNLHKQSVLSRASFRDRQVLHPSHLSLVEAMTKLRTLDMRMRVAKQQHLR